ncbi:MAG: hypothetical protein AB2604_10700 [Candidatus Thiodiazotropha taylori]
MRKRNWKRFRATSRRSAVEACVIHAREVLNKSVEQLAEEAGLNGHWPIYKWMESGDVPLRHVIPFQKACGSTFITDYLASATHKLVINIPTGKVPTSEDILKLQEHLNTTVGYILKFGEKQNEEHAEDAINALMASMEGLAFHKINIEKQHQPELELFGESNE